ncbi:MAG: C40 family peptidase [Fulvivirga sp.]|nr:C40 family peptidase [Fulvivirga sp.]
MEKGDKGICRLSIIPVRASGKDQAEIVTQLLFGDHYEVLEVAENKKWLKISIYYDGYVGWIDAKQFYPISREYFEQINNSDYKISTEVTSSILFKKHHIQVVMGSVLPISTNELFKVEEQLAFNGEAKSLSQRRDFEFLKQIANRYLNAPYLWGGRSPFGIDCSGFVQNVFRICGYSLPRDSSLQVKMGEHVKTVGESQPGDLAFFQNDEGSINHVGIVLEESQIIHASGKVRIDRLSEQGIVNSETDTVTHGISSVRRILR